MHTSPRNWILVLNAIQIEMGLCFPTSFILTSKNFDTNDTNVLIFHFLCHLYHIPCQLSDILVVGVSKSFLWSVYVWVTLGCTVHIHYLLHLVHFFLRVPFIENWAYSGFQMNSGKFDINCVLCIIIVAYLNKILDFVSILYCRLQCFSVFHYC